MRRDVATGNVYYYFQDMLGSSNVVATSTGTLENESDFYPYGGESPITTGLSNQKFKFTGKERDAESASTYQPQGLDYFGARYYSSSMGRFMSPDWSAKVEPVPYSKLDDPQSLNLYTYVRNHALSRFDRDGHMGLPDPSWWCTQDPGSLACSTEHQWNSDHGIADKMTPQAQQQSDSSNSGQSAWGRFKAGVRNLLHGHLWGYATVRTEEGPMTIHDDKDGPKNPAVSALSMGISLYGLANGRRTVQVAGDAVGMVNDHGTVNTVMTVAGDMAPDVLGDAIGGVGFVYGAGQYAGDFVTNNVLVPMLVSGSAAEADPVAPDGQRVRMDDDYGYYD